MNKIKLKNTVLSFSLAILMILIVLPNLTAQQIDYKNSLLLFTEDLDLDYEVLKQVWNAASVPVDFYIPVSGKKQASGDLAYLPRPYKEKINLLRKIYSKKNKSSDIAIVLARVLRAGGREKDADGIIQEYISAARAPDKRRKAADYYFAYLNIEDEIDTLFSALDTADREVKEEFLARIIERIKSYNVRNNLLEKAYRGLIESSIKKETRLREWFDYLVKKGKTAKAEALLDEYRDEYPRMSSFFNAYKADIHFAKGEKSKAIAIYYQLLEPSMKDGHFKEYFASLQKTKIYNESRRELFKKWKGGTASLIDLHVLQRMYLKSYNNRQAKSVLRDIAAMTQRKGNKTSDLHALAVAYELQGMPQEALKRYYALESGAASAPEKLKYIAEIEDVLFKNTTLFTQFLGRIATPWFGALTYENMPSVFGGVLSLLFNEADFTHASGDFNNVLRIGESRKIIFTLYERVNREYPGSSLAGKLLLDIAAIYQQYGMEDKSTKSAAKFIHSYASSEKCVRAYDIIIANYKAAKNKVKTLSAYSDLLSWLKGKKDNKRYREYFGKRKAWLVSKRNFAKAVALYWKEIKANPSDENLYAQFLDFVGRYNYRDEELKIYQRALGQFKDSKWTHKIARWYIKKKEWRKYADFTDRILGSFTDPELRKYLGNFESYVPSKSARKGRKEFYRRLYEYSLKKYPFNEYYLKGLLNYYKYYGNQSDFIKLSRKYFYVNDGCRRNVLSDYFRHNKKMHPGIGGMFSAQAPNLKTHAGISLAYSNAWLMGWFSHFEESIEYFEKITVIYPDNRFLAEYLASLYRSLGKTDQAVKLYRNLAGKYPKNVDYLTKAGETLADTYQLDLAVKYWEMILKVNPLEPELHHSVAAIFWDYYLFDKAADVFLSLRKKLDKPMLYADKLAAVYESSKKRKQAVYEYLNGIVSSDYYYWDKLDRLIYLAEKRKMGNTVAKAIREKMREYPNNESLFRAATSYFERRRDTASLERLYTGIISRSGSNMILTDIYYYYQGRNNREMQGKVMLRKLAVAEGESWILNDTIAYFEDTSNYRESERLLDGKIKNAAAESDEFPDEYISALDYAYRYYERRKNYDKALATLGRAIDFSKGQRKRTLQVRKARLLIDRNLLEEAGVILKDLAKRFPTNMSYLNALAEILTARSDFNSLVSFYTDAIVRMKKSPLHPSVKKANIAALRHGLINSYTKLKRYPEAVDQYIEILNREPLNDLLLANGYNYARDNGLIMRMISYYENTSKRSYKDYRWQVILAKLYLWSGKLDKAGEKYNLAIKNEPQRIELYNSLADILIRSNKYREAADVYARLYDLNEDNYDVLLKKADMLMRSGESGEAVDTALSASKAAKGDYKAHLKLAGLFEKWGQYTHALRQAESGINNYKSKIAAESLGRGDIELVARIYLKNGKSTLAVTQLFSLHEWLAKEQSKARRNSNYNAEWYMRRTLSSIEYVISDKLGPYYYDYAADAQLSSLIDRLFREYKTPGKSARYKNLIKGFAKKGKLQKLQESILLSEKKRPADMLRFFANRKNYGKMIKFIEPQKSSISSYQLKYLPDLYRISGDSKGELESLEFYLKRKAVSNPSFRSYFNRSELVVDRYFDLSLKTEKTRMSKLYAGRLRGYIGSLLNVLLRKGDYTSAIKILRENIMKRPAYWVAAKHTDILTAMRKYDRSLEKELGILLDLKSIKNQIGKKRGKSLKPAVWFTLAMKYAELADIGKMENRADLYMPGAIEELPKSSGKQLMTGNIYMKLSRYKKAQEHYELALQLSPKSNLIISKLGESLNRQGRKQAAMKVWKRLIAKSLLANYELYMKVLTENGYPKEGAGAYLGKLKTDIEKRSYKDDIIRKLSNGKRIAVERGLPFDAKSLARTVSKHKTGNITILSNIISNETLLRESDKGYYYNKVISTLESLKSTPSNQLQSWYRKYLSHLMKLKRTADALDFLQRIRKRDRHFAHLWIPEEMITVRSDMGHSVALPSAAGEYLKKQNVQAYRKFIARLQKKGREKERNALALEMYRKLVEKSRIINDMNLYGLASELMISGNMTEGEKVIQRLLTYKPDNTDGMMLAADLLEKHGKFPKAERIRKNIIKIAPDNQDNLLSMMKNQVSMRKIKEAKRYVSIILFGKNIRRAIRQNAADFIIDKLDFRSHLGKEIGSYVDREIAKNAINLDENSYLVAASFHDKTGNRQKARMLLIRAVRSLVKSSRAFFRLAAIYESENNMSAAVEMYKRSFDQEPENQDVLVRLFRLYYKQGDYIRAIKMTEAFDYHDDVRNKYADKPTGFVHIYRVLKDKNDQITFIKMMKETAQKLNSPTRLLYYHQLLMPLVKDDEKRFRVWLREKERYGKEIQDRLKKQKKSISIRWEL